MYRPNVYQSDLSSQTIIHTIFKFNRNCKRDSSATVKKLNQFKKNV